MTTVHVPQCFSYNSHMMYVCQFCYQNGHVTEGKSGFALRTLTILLIYAIILQEYCRNIVVKHAGIRSALKL